MKDLWDWGFGPAEVVDAVLPTVGARLAVGAHVPVQLLALLRCLLAYFPNKSGT